MFLIQGGFFAFVTEKSEILDTTMRTRTFALTLAMTAAASADLYSLEFTAMADFIGPVTGQLTHDLDEFGAGSFLGTVGTNFGPAVADGTAAFAPTLASGALDGTLDFGPLGSYNLILNFSPAVDPAVLAGTLTGPDGPMVSLAIFMDGWSITAVPAPGALALLGLAGLGRRRRA